MKQNEMIKFPNYEAKAIVQLLDKDTGEIIQEVEAHNALTPAGKQLLIKAFTEPLKRMMPGWSNTNPKNTQTGIGVLEDDYLFEYLVLGGDSTGLAVREDSDHPFMDIIGFARKDWLPTNAYSGTDKKRGRMEYNESKVDGNKITFSFIWNSFQAIGVIREIGWGGFSPRSFPISIYRTEQYTPSYVNTTSPTANNLRPLFVNKEKLSRLNISSPPSYISTIETRTGEIRIIGSNSGYFHVFRLDGNYLLLNGRVELSNSYYVISILQDPTTKQLYAIASYSSNTRLLKVDYDENSANQLTNFKSTKGDGTSDHNINTVNELSRGAIRRDKIYFFYNDASAKVGVFNLSTLSTKPDLKVANADEVIVLNTIPGSTLDSDTSSMWTLNGISQVQYNSSKDEFIVLSYNKENIAIIQGDFSKMKGSKFSGPENLMAISSSDKNGDYYTIDAAGTLYKNPDYGGMATKVKLPTPINKTDKQLLKVMYEFNITE